METDGALAHCQSMGSMMADDTYVTFDGRYHILECNRISKDTNPSHFKLAERIQRSRDFWRHLASSHLSKVSISKAEEQNNDERVRRSET